MRSFGSDNHSGIHPVILEAISNANNNHQVAYGDDIYTVKAQQLFNDIFGAKRSYFVFNGTGANVLGLRLLTCSFNSIICAQTAHINVDECGAPESQTGCKLVGIPTKDGKLTVELVMPYIVGVGVMHHSQPKVISISQPTELGTLYTVDEIAALSELAHSNNMYLHVDGARFSNALASLKVSGKDACKGIDVLSFGGTKNGLMIGEAVLVFNEDLAQDTIYIRKNITQLSSKMRFVGAQFYRYLSDGLYLELASNANNMAQYLASRLSEIEAVRITQKVESNGVFAVLDKQYVDRLHKKHSFFVWDEAISEIRLMCSFDTTKKDIDELIEDIKSIVCL